MKWIDFNQNKPDEGIEVIAYHPEWVEEDTNPKGTRVGFLNGDGEFYSARWCNYHDVYENDTKHLPIKWCDMPLSLTPNK